MKKTVRGQPAGCKRTTLALASGNYIRNNRGKIILHPTEGKVMQLAPNPASRKSHKKSGWRAPRRK